jgi:hypothetical protein
MTSYSKYSTLLGLNKLILMKSYILESPIKCVSFKLIQK